MMANALADRRQLELKSKTKQKREIKASPEKWGDYKESFHGRDGKKNRWGRRTNRKKKKFDD